MQLHKVKKKILAIFFVVMMLANSAAGTAAAITASSASEQATAAPDLTEQFARFAGQGVFDPLFETVGFYFEDLLGDERLAEVLESILTTMSEDERIAEFDVEAVAVAVLRDEHLSEILGDIIAEYLKDENLLSFIAQLTSDISALLQDEDFVNFFSGAVITLLNDERVSTFAANIAAAVIKLPQSINFDNLQDDEGIQAIVALFNELQKLFMSPLEHLIDDLLEDPRVHDALNNILDMVKEMPAEMLQGLAQDEEFNRSLEDLKSVFLEPLLQIPDQFVANILEQELLTLLLTVLLETLEEEEVLPQLLALVELIDGDLDAVIAVIMDEIDQVIDYFAAGASGGGGGCSIIDIIIDLINIIDQSQVVDEVAKFAMYWADVLAWVFGQKLDDLAPLGEAYFGSHAPYLPAITEAFLAAAEAAGEELLLKMEPVVREHAAGIEIEAIVLKYEEELALAMEDILLDFIAGDLATFLELAKGKGDVLLEVLLELAGNLPLSFLDLEGEGSLPDGDIAGLLKNIIAELPFDALADLVDEKQVKEVVSGLFNLVNDLPISALAPMIRENADYLGHTIASAILNGAADVIEASDEEELLDPQREAIMAAIKSEERLRRFYLDLGGKNEEALSELLESEAGEAALILQIIKEIVGDDERLTGFIELVEERSLPVKESLLDYGRILLADMTERLGAMMGPYARRIFASLTLFIMPAHLRDVTLADGFTPAALTDFAASVGTLAVEVLRLSKVDGFIDTIIASFLLESDTAKDLATFERFAVINQFYADIYRSEALKNLDAENFAPGFIELVESSIVEMRNQAGLLNLNSAAVAVNETLSSFLGSPGTVYYGSIDSLPISPEELINLVISPVQEILAGVREGVNALPEPLAALPSAFFGDIRVEKTIDDISGAAVDPTLHLIAAVLEEPRVAAAVRGISDEIISAGIDASRGIISDSRTSRALEDAVTSILTDEDLRAALSDLVGDLLSDPMLTGFIESGLHDSRIIAIDFTGSSSDRQYFRGDWQHSFQGHPDLPAPFAFSQRRVTALWFIPINVPPAYFQMGCNNGLFAFTETLIEWFDPAKPFTHVAPGAFFRDYVGDYLSEGLVRDKLAEPAVELARRVALNVVDSDLHQLLLASIDDYLATEPLAISAIYIRESSGLRGMIEDGIGAFPLGSIIDTLEKDGRLLGIIQESLNGLPLEQLIPFFQDNQKVIGIIEDAGVEVDLSPLRQLLRVDPATLTVVTDQLARFPAETITHFFQAEGRATRLGYILSDQESRIMLRLLGKEELTYLQSRLVNEKVAEADYSLAQKIFNLVERFAGHQGLSEVTGKTLSEAISGFFNTVKEYFTLLPRLLGSRGAGEEK